jgi:hypothetical protein
LGGIIIKVILIIKKIIYGVVVKEAFKDWKALASTPHEKG